jgi:hypothetical protein
MFWDVEHRIRECVRVGGFGPRFVELARSVYRNNDLRAATKRRINVLLWSVLNRCWCPTVGFDVVGIPVGATGARIRFLSIVHGLRIVWSAKRVKRTKGTTTFEEDAR